MASDPPGTGTTLPINALERVYYLYRGMQAIRQIGRLSQTERDPVVLLQQATYALEATGTYFDIWIDVTGQGFDCLVTSESISRDALVAARKELHQRKCILSLERSDQTSAFICPGTCGACPESPSGTAVQFISPLVYGERAYGYMKVGAPIQYSVEESEWEVIGNVSHDLAFALHNIEQRDQKERAEKALKESENRYKAIFEGSVEGIVIAEQQTSRVRYANPSYCQMFRYAPEEILGMEIGSLHQPDERPDVHPRRLHVGNGIEQGALEIVGTRSDGTLVNLAINSHTMEIDSVPCVVSFCTDVTASIEQLRKLRRYSASLHATIEGMLLADERGLIIDGNASAVDLLGYSSLAEILGRSLFEVSCGEEIAPELWQQLMESDSMERTGNMLHGNVMDVNAAIVRNDAGVIDGAVCTMTDVTERDQRERETREKNRILAAVNRVFHDAIEMQKFTDAVGLCLDVSLDLMDAEVGFFLKRDSDQRNETLYIKGTIDDTLRVVPLGGDEAVLPEQWTAKVSELNYFATSENHHPLPAVFGNDETVYGSVQLSAIEPLVNGSAILGLMSKESRVELSQIMALYILADALVHVLRRYQAEEQLKQARDELRLSHESFVNIVDRSQDGILVVGSDEIVRFANESAARGFETTLDELTGSWFNASSPGGQAREVGITLENGRVGTAEMAMQETVWEDEQATLVLLRDVTARKQAEMAQLELSRQMSRVIKKLQDLDSTKNEFIANTSHELKTPLNAIMGYLSLMTDGLGGELSPLQIKWSDSMARQSKTLLGLIDQILDFSKMEAGRLRIEPSLVRIEPLMNELQSIAEALVKEKPVEVHVSTDVAFDHFISDPQRLQQVIVNLVSNAAKFTAEGRIDLSVATTTEENVIFRVSDTGIGIKETDQQRIFSPFEQLDGTSTRKYGGTGLGLPIVRRLLALLEGTVTLHSELGSGSTFTIQLPRRLSAPADVEDSELLLT